MVSTCERCGERLKSAGRGRIPRFCSGRCRVAAHRARNRVPRELVERDRWVRRSEDKVPLTASGRAASSTDPATWSSYRDARRSTAGVGAGFVLNGDGIACIDLDHCVEGGKVAPWAQEILDKLPPTYVEVSPSGDGLHVFGVADFKGGRKVRVGDHKVEVYADRRYIAVTGRVFGDMPGRLGDLSEVIDSLL